MTTKVLSIALLTCVTFAKEAKKVPKDKDVISKIGSVSKEHQLNPNSIKILVWNMFKGAKPTFKNDYISVTQKSDILLLQEFYLSESMKMLFIRDIKKEYILATSFIAKRSEIPTGVTNASITTTTDLKFKRSPHREPVIKTPKMILMTKYKIKGHSENLLAVNIHAINFVSAKKLKAQLERSYNYIRKHIGPVIFAGDFNTWTKKKFRTLKEFMNGLEMKEVKFKDDTRMKVFNRPIDFIFYKGLEIKSSRVFGSVQGSDHKAMWAEFSATKKL